MSGSQFPVNAHLKARRPLSGLACAAFGLAVSYWGLAPGLGHAQAQMPRQNLGEALFGQKPDDGRSAPTPMIARFQSEDGAAFVLDRSQGPILFRFEASHEVWVLTPRRAGRGDLIYLDDAGQPLLRATKLGGMTVFTPETPTGSAAALAGRALPIHALSALSPTGLLQKLTLASARASRAVQKLITFDAEDVTTDSAPLFADSALTAAEAFVQLARQVDGRAKAIRIDRVLLVQGDNSDARRQGSQIVITIVPDDGVAGRPSSAKVAKAIAH
jgi:hypothetical protein